MAEKKIDMANPKYVGFGKRFIAFLLDIFILMLPLSIVQFAIAYATRKSSFNGLFDLLYLILVVYFDGIKGGTPGKLILGIRIVNEKGEFIGIPGAILRYIGKILSGIILGIGFLMIIWDKKKQGLHDMVAKTFVVQV